MKAVYQVRNVYWRDQAGPNNHRTPEAAFRAAQKREGEGWIVCRISDGDIAEVIEYDGRFYVGFNGGELEEI